jgi:ATP/maltotriose-dependent transcriptional regulator MalT
MKRRDSPAELPEDLLARGREAYDRQDFAAAFETLSSVDREQPLAGQDLDRLAVSAGVLGKDADFLRFLERAHQAHLESGDAAAAARSAFFIGFRLLNMGERGPGTGWLSRAQRVLDKSGVDCAERGYLRLAEARQLAERDAEGAISAAEEAIETGERFGDADLVALARSLQGHIRLGQEQFEEGLSLMDEAMVAVSSGELSPLMTAVIYCNVIRGCQNVYALDRAREWTHALQAWCEARPGAVTFSGHCLVYRSEILQMDGDWPKAIEEARLACERLSGGLDAREAALAFYQQGELLRLLGNFAEAEEAYESASRCGWDPHPGLALLRAAQGRLDAAAAAMRRVLAGTAGGMRRTHLLPAHVEIMIAAGDVEEAHRASAELDLLATKFDTEVVDAIAAHARGAVALAEGDAGAALPSLRRSFEIWRRLGAPYLAARVRVLVGKACRALGDEEGCSLETDAAREVFRELGAAPDLASLETPAGRAPSSRPHGLTPRELEVLRLVASGKTNKAIAAELFLSEKTIDRHLSNIFDKLDVPSRAAATAFAYEHHLV